MSTDRGHFVWYELMTTDPKAAIAFYGEVVGWGTQQWEGDMPYTMWTAATGPIGGVMELPDEARKMGAPPHWLAYVSTPDVDATTKQAAELGAKVYVTPTDIPKVGRFSIIADPQGAVIAPFTSANPMPPKEEGAKQDGTITWHELATTDPDAAWTFYSTLFGWEKTEAMDMGEMGVYQMYRAPGTQTLGGIYRKPAAVQAPPHWLLYAHVPDVDLAAERVKTYGGQVLNGPMEVPGGDRIVQCLDPQGAAFALHASAK